MVISYLRTTASLALCLALSAAPVVLHAQSAAVVSDEGSGAPLDARAVAVLPFSNISGEPSDDWIGAGIAETVSAHLSRLGMSSVVAGAAFADQGRPASDRVGLTDDARARQIARRLGVAWTVTGGFQRVGSQLRVIARIVDVESGDVRRTVKLDGTRDQLFAL